MRFGALTISDGGYPDGLAGLDLKLMEEHLTSEVEADVVMLRGVEKAYHIAFRRRTDHNTRTSELAPDRKLQLLPL